MNAASLCCALVIAGLIEDHKPKWLGGIEVARFNLGQQAPEVDNIQVDQVRPYLVFHFLFSTQALPFSS